MTTGPRYRVVELGGAFRGVKADELEALLNGAAADGWELDRLVPRGSSNMMLAIFCRGGDSRKAESRSRRGWISEWGRR